MDRLKNIIRSVFWTISNILIKEDRKIERLLKLEPREMYLLLPKCRRSIERDSIAIFDYGNLAVKSVIKSLKFKNNLQIKKRLALYVYDELVSVSSDVELFYGKPPIITATPMSSKEKKDRGFNQCEEVLSEVKSLGENSLDIRLGLLEKTRETRRQVKLSREERLKNLYQSNRVRKEKEMDIKDRVVIVFDDVYTTGATFGEARHALAAAGARKVLGLFLAH